VLREAKRRDADDVVFLSSDGYLLEGSTSNLLLKVGNKLVTPGVDLGILAGTTQGDLFRFAETLGLTTGYAKLGRSELDSADSAWLVSSVRHAAPIREVDGIERPVDHELTDALNAYLLGRTD
jgi:4-amino-4-deoxychorismate lyase